MSDEKKPEMRIDVDDLSHDLSVALNYAARVVKLGTPREQEALGFLFLNALRGTKAKADYVDKFPELPERHSKIMDSIRRGADELAEHGNCSMILVALVAARRIEALEDKNEKLTEMLMKADEKK